MTHSELLKFTFKYEGKCPSIPLIPLRFFDNNDKPTPTFDAILDSGADEITIPKNLADLLGYKLTKRSGKINTAGGVINAFKTKGKFNIGRGGREVKYSNVNICVIDHDIPVLVGIKPIFDNYKIKISAFENKCVLDPVQRRLSKEAIKQIEESRKRMNKGKYFTEEKAKELLGFQKDKMKELWDNPDDEAFDQA